MIKYASNAFLATKVSFINAIANLCEAVDADVREVAIGMGYDARIGFQFLHPGPGYGGSCFPKDVAALLHTAREAGYDFELLAGVVDVNRAAARAHRRQGAQRGRRRASSGARGRGVGPHVQGRHRRPARLAGVGDLPAASSKRARSCRRTTRRRETGRGASLPGLDLRPDPYDAAAGADVVALLTEWDEFRWLDFERVATSMRSRRSSTPATCSTRPPCAAAGFAYDGVGTPLDGANRRHRRRRVRRLAPLRGASRARRRGRRGRQPLDRPRARTSCTSLEAITVSRSSVPTSSTSFRSTAPSTACCTSRAREPARIPRDAARDARCRLDRHAARARSRRARTTRGSLLASTSEIYGDPLVHPQLESYHGNVDPTGRARSTTKRSGSPRRSR